MKGSLVLFYQNDEIVSSLYYLDKILFFGVGNKIDFYVIITCELRPRVLLPIYRGGKHCSYRRYFFFSIVTFDFWVMHRLRWQNNITHMIYLSFATRFRVEQKKIYLG